MDRVTSSRFPWVITAGIFLLALLEAGFKYALAFSESQTLVYAKQFAFPSYIPGDWYLSQAQLVRVPYQLLIYPLVAMFPLHTVSVLARLVGYLIVAGGLGVMCRQLRISAVHAWIGFGAFLMIGQASLPGREWIVGRAESKVLAYGLILLAVGLLMRRQLWAAGLAAGIATTLHILVGFWASLAIGIVVLVERFGDRRERAASAMSWCLGASFALYAVFARLAGPSAPLGVDVTDIWVNFRNPHYTVMSNWGWDEPAKVAVFLAYVAILVFARIVHRHSAAYRVAASFGLATLVPFGATVVAALTPWGPQVAFYLPFRVADTLLPLLACVLGVALAFQFVVQSRARSWVAATALMVVFASAGENFLDGVEHRRRVPLGGMTGSYSRATSLWEMCDFIRERTAPGTLIVTAPDEDLVNYACERPVIVTFRNIPSSAEGIAEWYRRLVELNGGVEPRRTGYSASSEISDNFQELPDARYQELGARYGSRYLLLRADTPSSLTRIFDNEHYAVFVLAAPGESG